MALLGAVTAGAATSAPAGAEGDRPSLDDVEAAYLYNFGRFVRWPAGTAQGPLLICIAGQDAFEHTMARLVAGEQVNGRPLAVKSLDHVQDAGTCSILFVGGSERQLTDGYLEATSGRAVLTVGDAPDFLLRGGIIQFVLESDHVRFAVNLDAANRSGLALSSELLKVAVRVTGGPGGWR